MIIAIVKLIKKQKKKYYNFFHFRREITEGLRILNKIDLQFIKIGVNMKPIYKKTKELAIFLVVLLFSMYLFYIMCSNIFLHVYEMYPSIFIWYTYLMPNFILSIVVLQFVFALYVVTNRMTCFNMLLKELKDYDDLPWTNNQPNKLYTVSANGTISLCQRNKKRYVILDSVGKIHHAICDAVDHLDQFFSIQMLVTCTVSFLLIIFGIYYTLISISGDDSDFWKYFGVIMFFLSQTCSYVFQVIACVNMCTLLYNEVIH